MSFEFDRDGFQRYMEDTFDGLSPFAIDMMDRTVNYALKHFWMNLSEFMNYMIEMIPEISEEEIYQFCKY